MHKICRHLPDKHVQSEPASFFGIYLIAIKPKKQWDVKNEIQLHFSHCELKTDLNIFFKLQEANDVF